MKILSALPISLGLSIGVLAYGLMSFQSQWAYSEVGHEYLALGFCVLCIVLFFTLRLSKTILSVIVGVLIFAVFTYANQKFEWRGNYVQAASASQYFPLNQYVERYPTFEEHTFAWLLDEPRWVDFAEQCYRPLLNASNMQDAKDSMNRHCRNEASIRDFYKVDVSEIINDYYRRMVNTAKQIEKERFRTKAQFEQCIKDKKCAMIPLLPEGVEVRATSDDYMDIRNQFWSLINDKTMSQENCDYFEFCRVMSDADIYKIPEPRT